MNGKSKSIQTMLGVVGTALVLLLLVQGCKKEEPMAKQTQPSQPAAKSQTDQVSATAEETAGTAKEIATDAADQVMAAAEQKTCPIMEGNPIDKNVFVEYKGKKVYFCCKGCPETFLADPEKYISKLPQFQD